MGNTFGSGIAEGVGMGINGLLGFMRQKTYDDYANMQKKRQAAELGMLAGESDDREIVPPASILAANRQAAPLTPAGAAKQYSEPSMIGMGEVAPSSKPMEMGGPPQQAPQAQPRAAAQGPYDFESMDPEQIQELFQGIGKRRKESELSRMNTLDMLRPAFHYKEKLAEAQPYMDMLAGAMREIKAAPQNPEKWRKAMAIMGTDDPEMAGEATIQKYMEYQQKYADLTSKFNTLSQSLASQGISPEMYGDEEKFIQLQNELQYRGRRQRTRPTPGAGILGRQPSMRQR